MIRILAPLFLIGGALAPVPAAAQTATVTVDPVRRALGHELAVLLNGEERTLAMALRALDEAMGPAMLADPDIAAMEKEYPGLVKACVEAMRPVLIRYTRASLPELWDRLAVLFATEMTEAELRAAIAFYRSPTGAKMLKVMEEQVDYGPLLTDMAKSGNYDVSPEALSRTARAGAQHLYTELSEEQRDEAARFAASPAGRKVVVLVPRVMAIHAEWSNESDPEFEAELEKVLVETVEKFTGMKIEL